MKSFSYAALASLALLSHGAFAATVYRCGDSYSQTPCPNGVEVRADDARDDSQRAAAQTALNRDKALVKDIETTRRKEAEQALAQNKAALARARAAHDKPDPEQKKAVAEPKKKASEKAPTKRVAKAKEAQAGVFTATVPDSKPKKKKKAAKP